ncbi:MAG: DNA cytosine methyltransferase [Ruminococcus sp.]|nr:DNA (cytosine-5-)-methyltransferase [Ruminococcus sp.]MBQ8965878.1 DNA cytosine methyltransferase [Ruminococcus sp.]
MTFIDFFAGVGGFRRGLELAGHKCLGFCEQDKFAVKSYRAIHETEGEWFADDIRTVRATDIPRADIWCAGFPCQDISLCGKRLGFRGKRSSLFFTVTSLITGSPRLVALFNL